MNQVMPAIFFGHGNPLNALAANSYTAGWAAVGRSVPRPKAVLAISAYWYIYCGAVTINQAPLPSLVNYGRFGRDAILSVPTEEIF